jgi:hypothetical protein
MRRAAVLADWTAGISSAAKTPVQTSMTKNITPKIPATIAHVLPLP